VVASAVMAASVAALDGAAGAVKSGRGGVAGDGTGRGVDTGRGLNIHIRRFGLRLRIHSILIGDLT